MGLFQKRKIQGDELLNYLDYIGEEWKLRSFQEKQSQAYTQALAAFDPKVAAKDAAAYKDLFSAANQLAQSAAELLRRKDAITPIPDKATTLFFAWHAAYTDYLAWAVAQAEAIVIKMGGETADAVKVKELQVKSEESRSEAEIEEGKLFKQLGLTQGDIDQLHDRATQAAEQDRWHPRTVTYKPKKELPRR
jgi:hypothetical protein